MCNQIHTIVEGPWIKRLYKHADLIPKHDFSSNYLDSKFYGNLQVYFVKGAVAPHTDGSVEENGLDEYSYILVLKCGTNVQLAQQGHNTITLKRGMLVQLMSWKIHELIQNKSQYFVFANVDSKVICDLDTVKKMFAHAVAETSV